MKSLLLYFQGRFIFTQTNKGKVKFESKGYIKHDSEKEKRETNLKQTFLVKLLKVNAAKINHPSV